MLLQLSVFYIAGPLLGARLPPQFSPRAAGTQSPASSTMSSQSGATSMHAAPSARPPTRSGASQPEQRPRRCGG